MKKAKLQFQQIKKIFRLYEVDFAYLFGSRARGTSSQKSDYDFAVYLSDTTPEKRFEKRIQLINELGKIFHPILVDVIVLNDTNSVALKYEAVIQAERIFEHNIAQRVDYEMRVYRDYFDFAPFLNAYNKKYLYSA